MINKNETTEHFYYGIAGFLCLLIGVGIARFSYTSILPFMIEAHWVNKLQAGYLGATNFLGYLLGAIFANNRKQFEGKEHAFEDMSYNGLLGDQVTVAMGFKL